MHMSKSDKNEPWRSNIYIFVPATIGPDPVKSWSRVAPTGYFIQNFGILWLCPITCSIAVIHFSYLNTRACESLLGFLLLPVLCEATDSPLQMVFYHSNAHSQEAEFLLLQGIPDCMKLSIIFILIQISNLMYFRIPSPNSLFEGLLSPVLTSPIKDQRRGEPSINKG